MSQPSSAVSIADIARLAGVGVGTASRALNNAHGVAPATRRKILEVAERMSYVVSPAAASLARGTTGRIALVIPHPSRWFFSEMTEAVTGVLRAAEIDVLLYHLTNSEDRRQFFSRLPARRNVDAVLVVASRVGPLEQERLSLMGVRIVAAGGPSAVYPFVRIDDYNASRQAMNHLLFLGHRRIAMLQAIDPDEPDANSQRSLAYFDSMREAGLEVDESLVMRADWNPENGAQSMAALLTLREPPTAVFAYSDEIALGAIRTLRRAGLRIPQDISIIGIDDHPLAALTDLTTIRQPVKEQGRRAAQMLVDLLQGRETEPAVTMPTELIVRSTTAPPSR